jgi:hypothetical protein
MGGVGWGEGWYALVLRGNARWGCLPDGAHVLSKSFLMVLSSRGFATELKVRRGEA